MKMKRFISHAEAGEGDPGVWLIVEPSRLDLVKVTLEEHNGPSQWSEVSAPDLFSYLGGLVLPEVERTGISPTGIAAFHADEVRVHRVTNGVMLAGKRLTPAQARALAACLLAAAIEAEGVDRG